jgi:hypothetical protein
MRKRPRVCLSLIVAETARSGQISRTEPPVLQLVSPTGGDLDDQSSRSASVEETGHFIWGGINHGLDVLEQFTRCRDVFDILAVQQSWAQRTQADYTSACALLTGAALSMMTGALSYPEPSSPA